MFKKYFIIIILISIFSISCVEKRDLSKNIVVAHILSNPDGLHPFNDNSVMRSFIFQYTHKTLMRLDLSTLEYIPSLAKELPKISENGLEYTFELKKGIKWDDGTPLTIDDIVFTTKLQLCPLTDNSAIRGNYTSVIKTIKTYPNNPNKFTMIAWEKNVTNSSIFSGIYLQQKNIGIQMVS